jgi:hypothetical protein
MVVLTCILFKFYMDISFYDSIGRFVGHVKVYLKDLSTCLHISMLVG